MSRQDDNIPWPQILNGIEKRGKLVISMETTRTFFHDRAYDVDESDVVLTNLYSHLPKCTSSTAAAKVKKGGYKSIFEMYRQLYEEDMKISQASLFAMMSSVYTFETAKYLRDIPSCSAKRKEDRDLLAKHGNFVMSLTDQHHRILMICTP